MMVTSLARSLAIGAFVAWLAAPVHAQDILSRARTAPTRADGIALLATHLAERPRDVDARVLYALMLSWEGSYDGARREFQRVLEQSPAYLDARVGLMNVEWWSGRVAAAREQVNLILQRDPGHPEARLVRQRLDAANRPWQATTAISVDRFNDGRRAWHEQQVSVSRQTAVGSVIGRARRAHRFSSTDQQFEVDFYPSLRPGTYGFVSVGVSPDHLLYPTRRFAFDLYQNVGHGIELSGGYRRLEFTDATSIYVGTVTKYLGNWMLTGKLYRVPAPGMLDSTSGHAVARRYFGGDGSSFVGFGYSQGLSREEIRGIGDLIALDSQTVRGQVDALVTSRLRLQVEASTSRQERTSGRALWQTSVSSGFSVRF
jgi:YaiO family outer membrane protein